MKNYKSMVASLLGAVLLFTGCNGQSQNINLGQSDSISEHAGNTQQNLQSDSTQELIDSITPETAEAKGICGADLTWYYQDNVLVIKGTGEMTEYDRCEALPWFDYIYEIGKVVIEEGCTSICSNMLYSGDPFSPYESSLSSVIMPETVTSIGTSAFVYCENLQTVVFGDGLKEIGAYAFQNCEKLGHIDLPDGLEKIGERAFESCSLEQIYLPASVKEFDASIVFIGTDVVIDENSPNFTVIDGVIFTKDLKTLVLYPRSKKDTSYEVPDGTEVIGAHAFSASTVSHIVFPDSIKRVEGYAISDALATTLPEGLTKGEDGVWE